MNSLYNLLPQIPNFIYHNDKFFSFALAQKGPSVYALSPSGLLRRVQI